MVMAATGNGPKPPITSSTVPRLPPTRRHSSHSGQEIAYVNVKKINLCRRVQRHVGVRAKAQGRHRFGGRRSSLRDDQWRLYPYDRTTSVGGIWMQLGTWRCGMRNEIVIRLGDSPSPKA
jgi:hypothetical protein